MKTNTSKKTLNRSRFVSFKAHWMTLAVGIAAGLAASSYAAQVGYDLTLIENSSTSLTYTYTGPNTPPAFSIMPSGPDSWTITVVSQTITLNPLFEYDFAEPEDPTNQIVNNVSHDAMMSPNIFVKSDLPIELDNGGYIGISDFIGTDGGIPIQLFFNDVAAASEAATGVPDTGSTLGLLAVAFAALLGGSRVRSLRLA